MKKVSQRIEMKSANAVQAREKIGALTTPSDMKGVKLLIAGLLFL